MPRGKDWIELVRSTFRSVGREEMSGLYAREWRHAKEKLTAEEREEIEREPRRLKRFLKSANAVLFGLSRRLAPARRVVFGAALLFILLSLQGKCSSHTERTRNGRHRTDRISGFLDSGFLLASITLLTLLLGMELVDKINYRDELDLARELQSSLIPKTLPASPGFELGAYNRIANMVGGDIYDFVLLPDGRLAVLFGDASGHGMTAGLVMAVAHAAFRTQLETDPAPEAMFATLNRILCRTGGPRAFFGCVYLLISPDGDLRGLRRRTPTGAADRRRPAKSATASAREPIRSASRPPLSWETFSRPDRTRRDPAPPLRRALGSARWLGLGVRRDAPGPFSAAGRLASGARSGRLARRGSHGLLRPRGPRGRRLDRRGAERRSALRQREAGSL